jgi:hypothetical protein
MAEQANKALHSHSPEKQTAVAANGSSPSLIHSANAHALFTEIVRWQRMTTLLEHK